VITRPEWLLLALAAALSVLIAAEWLLPGAMPPSAPRFTTAAATGTANGSSAATSQWTDAILARPIFSASRRPDDEPGTVTQAAPPRLSAIIITATGRLAVFAPDGQKPQSRTEGGEIDGYRLQRIAPDRVELIGPFGRLSLRPQFHAAS